MAFTGVKYNKYFDFITDHAYSNFYDLAKKTLNVERALYNYINQQIENEDLQKVNDELYTVVTTEKEFPMVQNKISIGPIGPGISDYYRLKNVSAHFIDYFSAVIIATTSMGPLEVTLSEPINWRNGERMMFVMNNTNGFRYIEKTGRTTAKLFFDKKLRQPVPAITPLVGTGSIGREYYNVAKPYISGQKTAKSHTPTVRTPKYEMADGFLKIYPIDVVCDKIKADYYKKPRIPVLTDDVYDLLQDCNALFWFSLAEKQAELMSLPIKDLQLRAGMQQELLTQD